MVASPSTQASRPKRKRAKDDEPSLPLARKVQKKRINKGKEAIQKEISWSCIGVSQDWILDMMEELEFLEGPQDLELLARLMYGDVRTSVCFTHLVQLRIVSRNRRRRKLGDAGRGVG